MSLGLASFALQLYFLIKAQNTVLEIKKVKDVSTLYDAEHPTYCVLAVYILRTLQLALVVGLVAQGLRLVFV